MNRRSFFKSLASAILATHLAKGFGAEEIALPVITDRPRKIVLRAVHEIRAGELLFFHGEDVIVFEQDEVITVRPVRGINYVLEPLE